MSNYQTYQPQNPPPKKSSGPFCLIAGVLGCFGLFIFVIFGIIALALMSPEFMKGFNTGLTNGLVEAHLNKECADENKDSPKMIDSITRQDSARVEPPRTIIYHYTILKSADAMDKDAFATAMKTQILKSFKTDPGYKYYRDNQVTIIFEYYDPQGVELAKVQVGPDDL